MAPQKNAPPADLGKLTFASLREHMRFSGGKTVLQHFRDLDLDASGELNKKEFAKAVKAMGFPSATKEPSSTLPRT
jgi:Ca2+-binding EF-hand superfamily protein